MQQMQDRGIDPPLPDNPAPFLVNYLFEIGPTVPAGMGSGAIGWRDIDAWCERTGIELPPWQARLLRTLSSEYAAMKYEAEKPSCPSPMSEEAALITKREFVSRGLASIFRSMAKGV